MTTLYGQDVWLDVKSMKTEMGDASMYAKLATLALQTLQLLSIPASNADIVKSF